MGFHIAAASSTASIVAAIEGGTATLILALMAWRASSYKQLLKDVKQIVVQALEEAFGEQPPGRPRRRWYDHAADDD